jgi:hypothetical protein
MLNSLKSLIVKQHEVVHSGCTGLCVTEQLYSLPAWLAVAVELYSLPAWLAGAVNNNNREFAVGCMMV